MELIEDKISEYKSNFSLDFRGIQNPKCKLNGDEVLLLEELSMSANLYLKGLLSDSLKNEFENKLNNLKTKLNKTELLKQLVEL